MSRINLVRLISLLCLVGMVWVGSWLIPRTIQEFESTDIPIFIDEAEVTLGQLTADRVLQDIEIKGKAPKTGYQRSEFGDGWASIDRCSVRNSILKRDLVGITVDSRCNVLTGVLNDPYTGGEVYFMRGEVTSQSVQIDHIVSLSNAWQTGAQYDSFDTRQKFANDPLNLIAVSGYINSQKGDSDAASWLPPNKSFRCEFIATQIAVKYKYDLWVTLAEKIAMERVLEECPRQLMPLAIAE